MGLLKGYNGFNNVETYELYSTLEYGEYRPSGHPRMVRCTKIGVPILLKQFVDAHPNLVSERGAVNPVIDPYDSSTWIKAYDGIYLSGLFVSASREYYDISFNLPHIYSGFYNPTTLSADTQETDNNTISIEIGFYIYDQPAELGLAHFNYIFPDYDSHSSIIYAPNSYTFIGNDAIISKGLSTGVGYTKLKINNEEYPTTEGDVYKPTISPSNLTVSSDVPETWYLLWDGPSHGMIDFGGVIVPENEGDDSEPDGGDGNYGHEDSDEIPDDGLPTISALSTGMIVAYHPSITNLQDLADYLFTSNVLETMKKHINDPMSYIISLHAIPFFPTDGTSREITSGNGIFGDLTGSGVTAPTIVNQYEQFDCGNVDVMECYGGFLDYDNYTKVSIYIPFCGTFTLDTNVVMKSVINLKYAIDVLSGQLVAKLKVTNNKGTNAQIYFFSGNCSAQVPLSESSYFGMYSGLIDSIVNVGASLGSGNPLDTAQSIIGGIGSMKVERSRTGNISTQQGFLSNYTPYIMIERPAQSFPLYNNKLLGRPSNIGGTLNSFSGYTEIEYIKLDGIQATDSELDEIRQLLANGVYI